jgi:hypothetical protein
VVEHQPSKVRPWIQHPLSLKETQTYSARNQAHDWEKGFNYAKLECCFQFRLLLILDAAVHVKKSIAPSVLEKVEKRWARMQLRICFWSANRNWLQVWEGKAVSKKHVKCSNTSLFLPSQIIPSKAIHVRTQQKEFICESRRQASEVSNPAYTFILDFSKTEWFLKLPGLLIFCYRSSPKRIQILSGNTSLKFDSISKVKTSKAFLFTWRVC